MLKTSLVPIFGPRTHDYHLCHKPNSDKSNQKHLKFWNDSAGFIWTDSTRYFASFQNGGIYNNTPATQASPQFATFSEQRTNKVVSEDEVEKSISSREIEYKQDEKPDAGKNDIFILSPSVDGSVTDTIFLALHPEYICLVLLILDSIILTYRLTRLYVEVATIRAGYKRKIYMDSHGLNGILKNPGEGNHKSLLASADTTANCWDSKPNNVDYMKELTPDSKPIGNALKTPCTKSMSLELFYEVGSKEISSDSHANAYRLLGPHGGYYDFGNNFCDSQKSPQLGCFKDSPSDGDTHYYRNYHHKVDLFWGVLTHRHALPKTVASVFVVLIFFLAVNQVTNVFSSDFLTSFSGLRLFIDVWARSVDQLADSLERETADSTNELKRFLSNFVTLKQLQGVCELVTLCEQLHWSIIYNSNKTYVRPILEYASTVWSPSYITDIIAIERVQKDFTKRTPGCSHMSYPERLTALKLQSLEHRRLIADLTMVYNIIHDQISINTHLFTPSPNQNLRGHPLKLTVPLAKSNIQKHFFSHRVIPIWNSLPSQVVLAPSTVSFKKQINKIDLNKHLIFRSIYS